MERLSAILMALWVSVAMAEGTGAPELAVASLNGTEVTAAAVRLAGAAVAGAGVMDTAQLTCRLQEEYVVLNVADRRAEQLHVVVRVGDTLTPAAPLGAWSSLGPMAMPLVCEAHLPGLPPEYTRSYTVLHASDFAAAPSVRFSFRKGLYPTASADAAGRAASGAVAFVGEIHCAPCTAFAAQLAAAEAGLGARAAAEAGQGARAAAEAGQGAQAAAEQLAHHPTSDELKAMYGVPGDDSMWSDEAQPHKLPPKDAANQMEELRDAAMGKVKRAFSTMLEMGDPTHVPRALHALAEDLQLTLAARYNLTAAEFHTSAVEAGLSGAMLPPRGIACDAHSHGATGAIVVLSLLAAVELCVIVGAGYWYHRTRNVRGDRANGAQGPSGAPGIRLTPLKRKDSNLPILGENATTA